MANEIKSFHNDLREQDKSLRTIYNITGGHNGRN